MKRFTLIELLVVISILGILMTLLFPSLADARERTKIAVCQSNMKQIYGAITMYASNWDEVMAPSRYNDRLPAGSGAAYYSDSVLTGKYAGNESKNYGFVSGGEASVYFCPSTPREDPYVRSNGNRQTSISQNSRLANDTDWNRIHIFNEPTRLALLVDGGASGRFHPGHGTNPPNEGSDENAELSWSFGTKDSHYNWRKRHLKGTNIGFLDGHVIFSRNFRNDTKSGKYILDE